MAEPTHTRSHHPYAYRCHEWAKILTIAPSEERDCYVIEFEDGATDFWVVDDPDGQYEFKPKEARTG